MITVLLPLKTVTGLNAREHHMQRSRRVRNERQTARVMVISTLAVCAVGLPCVVTLTRISPGIADDDNLQGAAKAIRDGIADALGVNDNDSRIEWRYAQEKCKRGEFGMRVEICAAASGRLAP